MNRLFFGISVLLLPSVAFASLMETAYPLQEYTWKNPDFRQRFLGSYGVLMPVEPTLSAEDSRFLREVVLPQIQRDPGEVQKRIEERLRQDMSAPLLFVLGNLQLERGETRQAIASLQRALSLYPDFRRAHRSLALAFVREEDYASSLPHWRRVIALGGGDDQSHGLLAYALLQSEHWQGAARAFELALIFNPASEDLLRGLAHARIQAGDGVLAAGVIQELVDRYPEKADYWKLLANLRLDRGEHPEAAAALEVAHELGGASPGSLNLLGNLYLNLEMPVQAVRAYTAVFQLGALAASFEEALAPVGGLIDRGHWSETAQFVDALQSAFGHDLEARQINRLNAYRSLVQLSLFPSPEAVATAAEYADRFPLDGRLLLALADYYAAAGSVDEALLAYTRAARVDETRPAALLRQGNLLAGEQRYAEAREVFQQLLSQRYDASVANFIENLRRAEAARQIGR